MFVQFGIGFEMLPGSVPARAAGKPKEEAPGVAGACGSDFARKITGDLGCYYLKVCRSSAWSAGRVMSPELIPPGMEIERISVMQELADLRLQVVVSSLVAATIFPVVRRWFMSREK